MDKYVLYFIFFYPTVWEVGSLSEGARHYPIWTRKYDSLPKGATLTLFFDRKNKELDVIYVDPEDDHIHLLGRMPFPFEVGELSSDVSLAFA